MLPVLPACTNTSGNPESAAQTVCLISCQMQLTEACMVQGIVGSTPWNAMIFFTLWLQLLGFTDYSASVLMALFAGGCAIGSAVGGYLGQSSQVSEP